MEFTFSKPWTGRLPRRRVQSNPFARDAFAGLHGAVVGPCAFKDGDDDDDSSDDSDDDGDGDDAAKGLSKKALADVKRLVRDGVTAQVRKLVEKKFGVMEGSLIKKVSAIMAEHLGSDDTDDDDDDDVDDKKKSPAMRKLEKRLKNVETENATLKETREKERKEAKAKDKLIALAKLAKDAGFEEPDEVADRFAARSDFDDDDELMVGDKPVAEALESWKKTSVGKRFLPAPKGDGSDATTVKNGMKPRTPAGAKPKVDGSDIVSALQNL